jgi:hypothetical protein
LQTAQKLNEEIAIIIMHQINVDMGTAPIAVIAGSRGFNLLVNVVVLAASARLNGRRPASDAVHCAHVARG